MRGPVVDGEHTFVGTPTWLGPSPAPVDRDEALARLARRYLVGHGPAADRDLAKWAGLSLGDARRGLQVIERGTVPVADGLVDVADRGTPAPLPPPRLLGPFDPLLHGWASREPFTGPHTGVVTTNGLFRPVALVDGHVVATWRLAGGRVTIAPLEPVADAALAALELDAAEVLRYLGLPDTPVVVGDR